MTADLDEIRRKVLAALSAEEIEALRQHDAEVVAKSEKLGYSRGYVAGKKRKHKDITVEGLQRERQAFWDKAFLVALPACVNAQGWTHDGKPISSIDARTSLAKDFATAALRLRKFV